VKLVSLVLSLISDITNILSHIILVSEHGLGGKSCISI